MNIKCSCMVVVCFLTITLDLSRFVTMEEIPLCQEGNGFTAQSCCPCFRDEICSTACPGDYVTIKPASTDSCETKSTITTPASANTTTENTASMNIDTTASKNTMWSSTAVNVTDDDIIGVICLKCDDACLKCAWPDGKNCTVCNFLYNDTCYSRCPENTVASTNVTQHGGKLCENKHDETEQSLPIAAIAGGAGGVVMIIIVIIILVYFGRGHLNTDSTKKRAMSVILEQQQSKDRTGKEAANRKTDRRRGSYENTSTTLPQPIDIQRQGDAVLRYTRDPTFKETKNKDVPESNDRDSTYANAAMIRLAANNDLSRVKDSELKDKLEIEEIGVAPSAPVPITTTKQNKPQPVPTAAKQKQPRPVPTVATKLKKRKRTVKTQPVQPDVHEPGDYLDMSHSAISTAVDTGPAADTELGPASDLEDYENFSFSQIPQERLANQTRAHEKTSPEGGMEIYENTQADQYSNSDGDSSNLKDYENTQQFYKHSERSKEEASEDLEDYENMKDLDVYENTNP